MLSLLLLATAATASVMPSVTPAHLLPVTRRSLAAVKSNMEFEKLLEPMRATLDRRELGESLVRHMDAMASSSKRQTYAAQECIDARQALAPLIGPNGQCMGIFRELGNNSLTGEQKADSAEAFCDGSCRSDLVQGVRELVRGCGLNNIDGREAKDFITLIRDLVGVVCVQHEGDYCFRKWVNFQTAIADAKGGTLAEAAAVAEAHCSQCVFKIVKRTLEFQSRRETETPAQFRRRVRDTVGLRFFCSKSLVDSSSYCLTELSAFNDTISSSNALQIDPTNTTSFVAFFNQTFDQLCSLSGCIQRFVIGSRVFDKSDNTSTPLADEEEHLSNLRAICLRDGESNICMKKGIHHLLDFMSNVQDDLAAGQGNFMHIDGFVPEEDFAEEEGPFSNKAKCGEADSGIRRSMKNFNDRMGCCMQPMLYTFGRLDEDDTEAEMDAETFRWQRFLEFVGGPCQQTIAEPCTMSRVKFRVKVLNLKKAYFEANREQILAALREDFAGNAGANGNLVTIAEVADEKRQVAEDFIEVDIDSGDAYATRAQATGVSNELFATNDSFVAADTAAVVPDTARANQLDGFNAEQEGEATVEDAQPAVFFTNLDLSGDAARMLPSSLALLALLLASLL